MKNQDLNPLDIRLSPHQSRLIIDSRSLAVKLERLQKFIAGSPEFQELSSDDKFDMRRQRDVMDAYLKILNLRIDRISIPTPGEQVQATGVNLLFENAPKAMTEDPVRATRRSERISKNLGEPLFKKARQMNMISFDMSGPPLSDNMKKVLSDMLMKQAIKRVMGVDQGQAPKAEPVGMDPQADSFEAIQEPPMRRFQVQTVTTKTELTTIGAFDEQDAIARVGNGQGDTGKNQLTVTSTAQLFA